MVVIETKRLTLSQLTVEDADFILELFNDALFLKFIGNRGIQTQEDARNYIVNGPLHSYKQHGFGLLLARRKIDDVPIGTCGLLKRESLDDVDIGYAFLAPFRRQGFAFEAATAVTNYSKNSLNLRRIAAITAPNNIYSINLLDKLGFHFDKIIRLSMDGEESKLFMTNFQ